MHQGSVKELALAVLGRASEHASDAHQGDASPPLAEGPLYVRAPRELRCERCRDLEARGVAVLLCSECDVLTHGPEDCPRCQRLGALCRDHYRHPAREEA